MINVTINDKKVQAEEGATILQVAQANGIDIPTLCHHPALEAQGACRICTVEAVRGKRKRFVTACNFPVAEGLEVYTHSEEVLSARRTIIELLLARCPSVEILQKLAKQLGVDRPRFALENDECILCGLCVRMCEQRMGRSAISLVGRGIDMKVDTPFHIQTDVCMACGACVSVCPTGVLKIGDITKQKPNPIASEFEEGLRPRSPIYLPYLQAVPNVPVIDRDKCIHFKTGLCGICQTVCKPGAIDYDQQDEIVDIEVGSIILAPGFDEFSAGSDSTFEHGYTSVVSQYGYSKYPNVVTSIEFERILSASGPYEGHLLRPSDKKPPKKIAWLQCVGSRDVACDSGYCSSVCCMYAIKEAVIAKEHSHDPLDITIFYMDMRTFGKDFDKYYERARDEYGIRFVRSKVYGIQEFDGTGNLQIRYAEEGGAVRTEEFDMVTLSVGLKPKKTAVELAGRLGIDLNEYNFCKTDGFTPVNTSREGIYVCGAFQGPKDIPETVMQASGAAAASAALLSEARGTLVKKREFPSEKVVAGEPPRIGVFVCHCGINIGGVVNVPAVKEYAASLPNVVFVDENLYTCSQDTQENIKEKIEKHRLNRVVVASCSPRTHEPLFQETIQEQGLNKYLFEMANIRDQCSWVHQKEPANATQKAKDLVRMAVAKTRLAQPLQQISLKTTPVALVMGGGISGMVSAVNLADQGFEVHLVEKGMTLGGMAKKIHFTLEGGDVQVYLKELIEKVTHHAKIQVYLRAAIAETSGYIGNFVTKISFGTKKEVKEVKHGAVVIATGADEAKTADFLYKKHRGVVSLLELESEIVKQSKKVKDCQT
ncbi:MAG: FAD-dependent oxidoreductase, partial [Proteobacteria bacterium]|nr:FAD-dependent oxidoreductase [Pseudomonadota bacterium]